MNASARLHALLAPVLLASLACAGTGAQTSTTAAKAGKEETPVLVGSVTREQVEAAVPAWVEAEVAADPDREAASRLTGVAPGAEVTVFLGTWCGDSRRELSRFWRAVDEVGGALPFEVAYVGVDREKKEPADLVAPSGILYVPTFIVKRDGQEVGRIVEQSPHGIEQDLLALLNGEARGLVTAKAELLDAGRSDR